MAVTRPSAVVPNVGPHRRHKDQLKWKQKMWRCRAYCLAPAFTTQETHILFMYRIIRVIRVIRVIRAIGLIRVIMVMLLGLQGAGLVLCC